MGYEKQTFVDKETVLKAEYLERMEDGIIGAEELLCVTVAVNDGISGENGSISAGTDITFSELQLAYESGKLPYVKLVSGDGESTVLHLVKYYGDAMVFSNAVGAASMSDIEDMALSATISSSGDVDVSWNTRSSGGVSSWNDLADKPFYEESGTEVLLTETDYSFVLDSGFGCYAHSELAQLFLLEDGQEYIVVWDENEYARTAFSFTAANGSACVAVGNPVCRGEAPNEDSFAIVCDITYGYVHFLSLETLDAHKVGISRDATVIKTLDEKYLPMDAIDERIETYISEALEGDY